MHLGITGPFLVGIDILHLPSLPVQVPSSPDRAALVEISCSTVHLVARTAIAIHRAGLRMGCEQDLPMVVAALLLARTWYRSGTENLPLHFSACPINRYQSQLYMCYGRVAETASYVGGPRFRSPPGDRPSWFSSVPQMKEPGYYLK